MTANGYLQLALYFAVLLALAWPLGIYMQRVYEGDLPVYVRWLGPVERALYRICSVRAEEDMHWTRYAFAFLCFNLLGVLVVYALQRLQGVLPLNPAGMAATTPDLAFNTAASFATNTNWQSYGGEATMSYLTQMLGLAVQNFLSAASGMATLIALVRGFVRREASGVGNFWVDIVRSTLYVLLPLSLIFAVVLVGQGVVQTFDAYQTVDLVQPVEYEQPQTGTDGQPVKDEKGQPVMEKVTATTQTIAVGPAASQIAIKQLGTNGGGFFNVNSAHPFENPTPLTNFLELLAILQIGAALCITFGRMVKDTRQGIASGNRDPGRDDHRAGYTTRGLRGVRTGGQSAVRPARPGDRRVRCAGGWQHGRQGDALRHRQFRALGDGDHGRVERFGECDARFFYTARRAGADVVDPAW